MRMHLLLLGEELRVYKSYSATYAYALITIITVNKKEFDIIH